MQFGIYLNQAAHHPGHPVWPELAEQATLADALGYDLLGLGERHVHPPGFHEMLTTLGALVPITRRVRLCSAGFILAAYPAPFLAAAAANLSIISGGRFALGVVLGYRPEELALFGIPKEQRAKMFEERLTQLRQMLDAEITDPPAAPFISFKPVQMPLWIGAAAPPAVRRAAQMADGWIASANLSKPELAALVPMYRDECAKHGKRGTVVLMRDGFVAETAAQADSVFAGPLLHLTRLYADWKRASDEVGRYQAPDFAALRHRIICGAPADCHEQIAEYAGLGADMLMLRFQPPTLPHHHALQCIRLFAESVIPCWKEAAKENP